MDGESSAQLHKRKNSVGGELSLCINSHKDSSPSNIHAKAISERKVTERNKNVGWSPMKDPLIGSYDINR
jgi:hypothetical protein